MVIEVPVNSNVFLETDVSVESVVASDELKSGLGFQNVLWFMVGIFMMVGHGEVTNDLCAQFRRFKGCLGEFGAHDKTDLYGHNFAGKMVVTKRFYSCNSPQCPKCFKKGWAAREAEKGTARLMEIAKKFGVIEHGTLSVPLSHRDRVKNMNAVEFKKYWRWMESRLVARGILGGMTVFHPFRYSRVLGWFFSPHFHFLGVVVPSYGECRRCTDRICLGKNKEFLLCRKKGFEAVTRREYEKDKCIVKIFGARGKAWKTFYIDGEKVRVPSVEDNIFGTIIYELTHAGFVVGSKRATVVHWFGVASYRKLKVTVEHRKELCPICDEEFVNLVRASYNFELPRGSGVHVIDLCDANGNPRFVEAPDKREYE